VVDAIRYASDMPENTLLHDPPITGIAEFCATNIYVHVPQLGLVVPFSGRFCAALFAWRKATLLIEKAINLFGRRSAKRLREFMVVQLIDR
jgi:hypothetical protein